MSLPTYTQSKGVQTETVTVQGNVSNDDSVKMSVSVEGAAHIMSLLTDLYSDPDLAVMREYSSNAYDSHKAAGQTRPVEITLPSGLSPSFVVQDFGVGMSADEIRNIYSSYGASTKRDDFTQIGAFGLGCKSALTLTQSFTIKSIKDGEVTVAIISRGQDGIGSVNIVSKHSTNESNGVTVTIPVPSPSNFHARVQKVFYAWPKGSVLIDGSVPASLYTDTDLRKSSSGLFYIDLKNAERGYYGRTNTSVIIGGVTYAVDPYKATADYNIRQTFDNKIFVEIPIGSIDLTPSREDIRYSDRTKKFLTELMRQVTKELPEMIINDVKSARDRKEAINLAHFYSRSYYQYVSATKLTWEDKIVPQSFELFGSMHTYNQSAGRMQNEGGHLKLDLRASGLKKTAIVIEPDAVKVTRLKRNIKNALIETYDVDWTKVRLLITEKDSLKNNIWITDNDHYEFVTADSLIEAASRYRKKNRQPAGQRTKLSEITYNALSYDKAEDEIVSVDVTQGDMTVPTYYIHEDKLMATRGQKQALLTAWNTLGLKEDNLIVIMPKSRSIEALEKRVGKPIPHIGTLVNKATASSDLVEALIAGGAYSALAKILDTFGKISTNFGDADLDEAIKAVATARTVVASRATLSVFSLQQVFIDAANRGHLRLNQLTSRFPLVDPSNYSTWYLLDKNPKHVKLYIEAVLQNERETK